MNKQNWRIIPQTNFKFEMNDKKEIRKRGRKGLYNSINDDFRFMFVRKINEPIPARTREEVYELTFKDKDYEPPVIPEECKTRGDKFLDAMRSEGCEPLTEYINIMTKIDYLYEGVKYSVSPNKWIHYGTRPHKLMRKFNIEYVKQMFDKYGCELLEDKWVNKDTPMRYRYDGKEYVQTWNNWRVKFMKKK